MRGVAPPHICLATLCAAFVATKATTVEWLGGNTVPLTPGQLGQQSSADYWSKGAYSASLVTATSDYIGVQFKVTTNAQLMLGLSNGNSELGGTTDIDFEIYPHATHPSSHYLYAKNGPSGGNYDWTGGPDFWAGGEADTFQIKLNDARDAVEYYRNGQKVHTASTAPTLPLLVDASLADGGAYDIQWIKAEPKASTNTTSLTNTSTITTTSTTTQAA